MTENEPGHHLWQHGVSVGLNDANGVGFWTEGLYLNPERDGTFHLAPLTPPTVPENRANWTVTTQWRAPEGDPMLWETQAWTLEDRGGAFALDLDWTIQAMVDLRFGKYGYGGLFLRMPWRAGNGAALRTSDGATTPGDAEGKRARWVGLSMPIPGRPQGPGCGLRCSRAATPCAGG